MVVDDEAVGGVGLTLHSDIERISAEIGYWLGEPVWGRGIGTAAVRAVTDYALGSLGLVRVYALPFAGNSASRRLLEKAGFACEGILKRAVIKDGVVLDQALYARVAS